MVVVPLYNAEQIKAWEDFTITDLQIDSIALMLNAANQFVKTFLSICNQKNIIVLCGKGNNGGDGYAIATLLQQKGFEVGVYEISNQPKTTEAQQTRANWIKAGNTISAIGDLLQLKLKSNTVFIDALFGTGLNKPVNTTLKTIFEFVATAADFIVAVDMPSGLPSAIGIYDQSTFNVLKADVTITFQIPKLTHLFQETGKFVGSLRIVPIGLSTHFLQRSPSDLFWVEKAQIPALETFNHKGTFGKSLLIAGSEEMPGAAILSTLGAIKMGVGLLHVLTHHSIRFLVLDKAPEAIVLQLLKWENSSQYKAMAIGPGLGHSYEAIQMVTDFLKLNYEGYCIIDADAINILANLANNNYDIQYPNHTVLTPHPKEMERLLGIEKSISSFELLNKTVAYSKRYNVFIVLKGAYSRIVTPEGKVYFNSTGTPAMGVGGSGDVLTGILLALFSKITSSYRMLDAIIAGVHLHGSAGNIAESEMGVFSASAICNCIPKAYKSIKKP